MGRIVGYIQFEDELDRVTQKAAIDKFVKEKFGTDKIDYVYENVKSFISWRNRTLGKEVLPSLNKGDVLVVSESKRLGNSTPEIDVLLMYIIDKGADVYEARLNTKLT